MLLTSNGWAYNMVISGFVLGTIIFACFVWIAIENFISVKQIYKFQNKTNNIYYDNLSKYLIRTLELVITILWVSEVAFFVASLITHHQYENNETHHLSTVASAIAITHNVIFLINAILIISYLVIAYYWNGSMIIVVDQDNLITASDLVPRNLITVSRIIGNHIFFKITYRDVNLKGNLKEVKLRYTKKLEKFLTTNGFYKGEADD